MMNYMVHMMNARFNASSDLKKTADGSIDVDHYLAKARAARAAYLKSRINTLICILKKPLHRAKANAAERCKPTIVGYHKMTLEI